MGCEEYLDCGELEAVCCTVPSMHLQHLFQRCSFAFQASFFHILKVVAHFRETILHTQAISRVAK